MFPQQEYSNLLLLYRMAEANAKPREAMSFTPVASRSVEASPILSQNQVASSPEAITKMEIKEEFDALKTHFNAYVFNKALETNWMVLENRSEIVNTTRNMLDSLETIYQYANRENLLKVENEGLWQYIQEKQKELADKNNRIAEMKKQINQLHQSREELLN